MALKTLIIVKEEFDRMIAQHDSNGSPRLATIFREMKVTLVERIEKECIEQRESDDDIDVVDLGEFTVEVERDPKALMRDHMRKGGDPATFATPTTPRCTWCKEVDAEAVNAFWVQEPGEFRDSKEALCEPCLNRMRKDGIQVEVFVERA